VLAAHLSHRSNGLTIVPAPASPCTEERPGETSVRLARRTAALADRTCAEYLIKNGGDALRYVGPVRARKTVVLLDDQITKGGTARRCIAELRAHGHSVQSSLSWSSSRLRYRGEMDGDPYGFCWLDGAVADLPVIAACPEHTRPL
jgi:predicted amidophosphoribosyltransferase